MRLKLRLKRTLAEYGFHFLSFLLLSLFHCQYLNIPGIGSVKGSEAKRQIDSAISSSISLSNILVLSNSLASGTCGGGGSGGGPPGSGSANDPEPNETFAGAYSINLSGGVGYTFSLTGQISSGSDIDLFSFLNTSVKKGISINFDSGDTTCTIFNSTNDQSSNNSTTHTSDPGSTFPSYGYAYSTIIGFNAGLGGNTYYTYLKCEGTSGQAYSFTITVDQIYSSSGGSGSSSSVTMENSYLSQAIFDSLISIDTGKSYTQDSVDNCVKSIRTKGSLYAIAKGEAVKQAKICGTSAEIPDRSIFLKDDCNLEETHWIQIDSFGIP
ncbi:TIGR04452 family lipoprotein [Leptospira wolffii]|uniref:TIGR04452 family lipoprotein n=1 Tax=Leptospira wolffii TaxID=409998 RepID=UPI00108242E2|nr:TIGR04452 family lipoprotein [Leptospira wolffii]TGL49340.1 TIGR04452 family lipoprotein [Leptospira wolffii]